MKVILIRHGETQWNRLGRYQGQADVALSEAGLEQAQCLGEHFPFDNIAAVYASDLSRAMSTAQEVARACKLQVIPCPELREIFFGEWEGLTYDEIHAKWPVEHDALFQEPDRIACPGGESFSEVQARAVAKLKELMAKHKDETIAIAAHGGVNRTILCHALGMPLKNMWRIRQDNTAINVISFYENGKVVVEAVNNIDHLKYSSNQAFQGDFSRRGKQNS